MPAHWLLAIPVFGLVGLVRYAYMALRAYCRLQSLSSVAPSSSGECGTRVGVLLGGRVRRGVRPATQHELGCVRGRDSALRRRREVLGVVLVSVGELRRCPVHQHVALVVRDYGRGQSRFPRQAAFTVVEDKYQPAQASDGWSLHRRRTGNVGCILARAVNDEQVAAMANRLADAVFLFLSPTTLARLRCHARGGREFVREPKVEPYGTVAVFRDVSGNLWDLFEPSSKS